MKTITHTEKTATMLSSDLEPIYQDFLKARTAYNNIGTLKSRYHRLKEKYGVIGVNGDVKPANMDYATYAKLIDKSYPLDKFPHRAKYFAASMLKLSANEVLEYKEQENRRIYSKAQNTIKLREVFEFAKRMNNVLKECSPFKYELLTSLAFMSGRRMSELVHSGVFEPDLDQPSHVLFFGQLKKKNVDVYSHPILGSTDDFMRGWTILKSNFGPFDSARAANMACAKGASRYIKTNMDIGIENPHFHQLRAVYAKICWELYGVNTRFNSMAYMSSILGHGSSMTLDPSVTIQYDSMRLEPSDIQSLKEYYNV